MMPLPGEDNNSPKTTMEAKNVCYESSEKKVTVSVSHINKLKKRANLRVPLKESARRDYEHDQQYYHYEVLFSSASTK